MVRAITRTGVCRVFCTSASLARDPTLYFSMRISPCVLHLFFRSDSLNVPQLMKCHSCFRAHQVEHFLDSLNWMSRCEAYVNVETKIRRVSAFVIKDRTSFTSKGYYVVCNPCTDVSTRLICHLEPIGRMKDSLRRIVPRIGETDFGSWAEKRYEAQEVLFD